jgi:hypothetical protein
MNIPMSLSGLNENIFSKKNITNEFLHNSQDFCIEDFISVFVVPLSVTILYSFYFISYGLSQSLLSI